MSNTTWIAVFIVAVIVFLLSRRTNQKATAIPSQTPSGTTHTTGNLPDGQYLAKYLDEKAEGDSRIVIILEVTDGKHKGTAVPVIFENAAAKRVLKLASRGFISRLAFEEVALASKLENNITYNEGFPFLVRTKDSKAVSAYIYDEQKIKTFMNKLAKDPSFIG